MTLYKYMRINGDGFWTQPITDDTVFFASMQELRKPNDPTELEHVWDSTSYFVNQYLAPALKVVCEKQFVAARIFCASKNLNRKCWDSFIGNGNGICYQFEFKKNKAESDVMSRGIVYSLDKNLNGPNYIKAQIKDSQIRRIFERKRRLLPAEAAQLISWLDGQGLNAAAVDYIIDEITFTKTTDYEHENEYRFAHLSERSDKPLLLKLIEGRKAKLSSLGLKIVKIYSNDPTAVKAVLNDHTIELSKPNF